MSISVIETGVATAVLTDLQGLVEEFDQGNDNVKNNTLEKIRINLENFSKKKLSADYKKLQTLYISMYARHVISKAPRHDEVETVKYFIDASNQLDDLNHFTKTKIQDIFLAKICINYLNGSSAIKQTINDLVQPTPMSDHTAKIYQAIKDIVALESKSFGPWGINLLGLVGLRGVLGSFDLNATMSNFSAFFALEYGVEQVIGNNATNTSNDPVEEQKLFTRNTIAIALVGLSTFGFGAYNMRCNKSKINNLKKQYQAQIAESVGGRNIPALKDDGIRFNAEELATVEVEH